MEFCNDAVKERFINMEKIKNGDSIVYRNREGIVYGRPREIKSRGLIYTIRIGDEYIKALPSELSLATKHG
jgi:hypothetical protein